MAPTFVVLLYYKFNPITDPDVFAAEHKRFCSANGIKGRILIGSKGINGTCAGLQSDIEAYKSFVHSLKGFEDLWFKEHTVERIPFRNLIVRSREEIVALGVEGLRKDSGQKEEVNVENPDGTQTENYITPSQFNEMIKQDDVVVFDTRNEIEYRVGHFKNAINPHVEHFRDLPAKLDEYTDLKNKKVIIYCTGGIRCEKLSPLLAKKGFTQVYQLEGGIYNYCAQFPEQEFVGDCFVFDSRMNIHFDKEGVKTADEVSPDKIISSCDFCGCKSNRIVNNESSNGRDMVICCADCDTKLDISRPRNEDEGYRA